MNIQRLILIDDNRVDNFVNLRMLKAAGLVGEFLVFENPREAFEWFCSPQGSDPNTAAESIVLLDINMPDLSGFQLMDKLEREHPTGLPDYLILMLTSSNDLADQVRASNYERVLGYFHKPLTVQKIEKSLIPLLGSLFDKAS